MRTASISRRFAHRVGRLAAALLLLAATGRPAAGRAATGRLFLLSSGGYDDDILGRSAASASRPDVTVASGFGQISPVADFRLRSGVWEMGAGYAYLYNRFFKSEAGAYQDHAGSINLAVRPSSRVRLGGELVGETFRRSRFSEYDLDRREGTLRLELLPIGRVTLRGVLSAGHEHYLHSALSPLQAGGDPDTLTQTDKPLDLEISAAVRPASGLSVEAGWVRLEANSNHRRYDYSGGQLFGGLTFSPSAGSSVAAAWLHEHRDYVPVRLIPTRRDHSDTWSLELRRRLYDRLAAVATGSRLNYRSTLTGYDFNQTRGRIGLEIRLGTVGRLAAASPAEPAWRSVLTGASRAAGGDSAGSPGSGRPVARSAPVISAGKTRFVCRAPGAHSVALVGSFNGWSRTAMPLKEAGGDGTWELSIRLAAGTYRYMFYVDGRDWRTPEDAPLYEDDGFGLTNGVLTVP